MKKAIVILLALAVLGGVVFAQDAAAPALVITGGVDGQFGIYNNSDKTVVDSSSSIDLDFDYAGPVFGLSAELEYALPGYTANSKNGDSVEAQFPAGVAGPGSPATQFPVSGAVYVNYAYGFGKFFGGKVKLDFGYMGFNTYRLRNVYAQAVIGGGAIANSGAALEVFPMEGLALAVNFPMKTEIGLVTAGTSQYTQETSDFAKEIDLFGKYTMADVGTFYVSYQMALDDNLFNFAANLDKLVPNASIMAGVTISGIGGEPDPQTTINLLGGYKFMDGAASVNEEADIYLEVADVEAFGWQSQTWANYRKGDIRGQIAVRLNNKRLLADDYVTYRIIPSVRFYSGDNYLNVGFQYDGSTQDGADPTWKIPVVYTIWF